MDDEFALCWNNFQDNIASGFQNLFDRGYLVDVTLACDGKLLQAHKIVLAICSPYFQEMFIANPCKHPIIVLKDISSTVMTELLQFMYQGVVNVKHTELSTFMKIAQTLQIKGLATSSTSKSFNQSHNQEDNERMSDINEEMQPISRKGIENKMNMSTVVNAKTDNVMTQPSSSNLKRNLDYEHFTMNSKKQLKRFSEVEPQSLNNNSMELSNADDAGLPPVPQISMVESRFDINNVKREVSDMPGSPGSVRNSVPSHFNFDYNVYQSRNIEYPNELHAENDFKGGNNYNDIPAGSNITMLTSTSLLHGNCIFNRNNTVATQQGMKTYWLCKSYRITMCRARCITHQGRIISATGVHNHQPHMKSSSGNEFFNPFMNSLHGGAQQVAGNENSSSTGSSTMSGPPNMRIPQNSNSSHNINNQQQQHLPFHSAQQYSSGYHQMHYSSELQGQHNYSSNNATVLQNMMQNVLSQNNLMHLTNMAPMLNPLSQYSSSVGNSSNSGTKIPLTGDYSTFQQAGRNSDDSHILDSQNVGNATAESSNRAGGCSNFTNNNNTNSNSNNNKSANSNENKDNGNNENGLSINSNNSSNQNNSSTMSNTNNNSNNSSTNSSNENSSNNVSGKSSSNNNSSDSIYYGGDSNSNNNDNINSSGVGAPVATVVNSTNSSNSNNNNNNSNVNSDSTNASNTGSNNENSNNSISSTNNSISNGRAVRPTMNTSVMSVNNTCENVPPISNDLAEANLISISPSQMTFKIERT